MFSKDPEEETTKSFEGQDWEAIDYISIFSLSATMAWWGVRNDEQRWEGDEVSERQAMESVGHFQSECEGLTQMWLPVNRTTMRVSGRAAKR